jgi:predicted RNase H-like HicB family nuclease
MILQYPAKIKYLAEDKAYLVEFPDLPGCLTEGKTLEEAAQNAKEALTGYQFSKEASKFLIHLQSRERMSI